MPRYIDKDKLVIWLNAVDGIIADCTVHPKTLYKQIITDIENFGSADVVEMEKYLELREAFVDFVCSGGNNPAPFCQNRCDGCVDSRGWCTYRKCNGFNPDGERKEQP